ERFQAPSLPRTPSFEAMRSLLSRHRDYDAPLPKTLDVSMFVERFEALLECPGSGLFKLTPEDANLVPSSRAGGSSYSMTQRQYDGFEHTLRLVDDKFQESGARDWAF